MLKVLRIPVSLFFFFFFLSLQLLLMIIQVREVILEAVLAGWVLVVPGQPRRGAGQRCHIAAWPGAGSKVLAAGNAAWLHLTPWAPTPRGGAWGAGDHPPIHTEGGQHRKEIRSPLTLLPFSPCR